MEKLFSLSGILLGLLSCIICELAEIPKSPLAYFLAKQVPERNG